MAKPLKPQRLADGTLSWKIQVSVRPFKRKTRAFTTRADAIAWRDATIAELKKQRDRLGADRAKENLAARENLAALTVSGLAKEYLKDPKTQELKSYADRERAIGWWVDRCGSERVMQFNVMKIRDARERLMVGRAPATVNRHLAAASKMWTWGILNDLVPQDLRWPKGLKLREPDARSRFLDDEEIDRLLKAAAKEGLTVRAAVLVSIATGLRKGELMRLKWPDVDLETQTLRVLLSKTGKRRAVHLPLSAVTALKELKAAPLVGVHVFVTEEGKPIWQGWLERRWQRIKTEASLADFRWHDLRHSCASILAQNGASLPEIGSVLGHRSSLTTQRYAHLIAGKAVKGHDVLDAKLTEASK